MAKKISLQVGKTYKVKDRTDKKYKIIEITGINKLQWKQTHSKTYTVLEHNNNNVWVWRFSKTEIKNYYQIIRTITQN